MIYFIKFLYKTFILPPGIIIFFMILYGIHLYKKGNKAYRGIALFAILLYFCSISLTGDFAIHTLEDDYIPPSYANGDAIIMLGGGATLDTPNVNVKGNLSGAAANRLLTCAELYNKLHVPVIISGGKVYEFTGDEAQICKSILINIGVKKSDIITDDKSLNTEENALNTAKILRQKGFVKPVLVTSAFHMRRSVLFFKKNNVQVIPYPCDYRVNVNKYITLDDFISNSDAMSNLSIAIKEYIGCIAALK